MTKKIAYTAQELAESFINGNRTHVFEQLDKLKGIHAALVAVGILRVLDGQGRGHLGEDFRGALATRYQMQLEGRAE